MQLPGGSARRVLFAGERLPNMKKFFSRKRLAMAFSVLGVVLMGVDLMLTRNFFTHIGELMALSIVCFVVGIVLDQGSKTTQRSETQSRRVKGAIRGKSS
jgi:hypothetical protein